MNAGLTVENDAICLQLRNYHVIPLNERLDRSELERAISRGVTAYPDLRRNGFYEIELDDRRVYVHVHHDLRTVYLVAYLG